MTEGYRHPKEALTQILHILVATAVICSMPKEEEWDEIVEAIAFAEKTIREDYIIIPRSRKMIKHYCDRCGRGYISTAEMVTIDISRVVNNIATGGSYEYCPTCFRQINKLYEFKHCEFADDQKPQK